MEQTNHSAGSKIIGHAGALESMLVPIFAQAPHLPHGWKKILADIAPWLSLICGVLGVIGIFALFGASAMLSSVAYLGAIGGEGYGTVIFITGILGLVSGVLYLLAFNPLRKMEKKGWNYMFYALIISVISTIVSIVLMGSGIGSIIGVLIGAYIVFEVRELYH